MPMKTYRVRVDFEDGYTVVSVTVPAGAAERLVLDRARKQVLPHSAFAASIVVA